LTLAAVASGQPALTSTNGFGNENSRRQFPEIIRHIRVDTAIALQ